MDIEPQLHYPFRFIRANALEMGEPDWRDFDAIHASPPCQFGTAYKRRPNHVKASPNLIAPTRALLEGTRLPYVIENVEYAREHLRDPVMLCGSSFDLDVRRHRLFECSFSLMVPPCDHARQMGCFPAATNRRENSRRTCEIGVWRIPLDVQQRAMGIDWMTLEELSEAIPPRYTEWIGERLLAEVHRRQKAPPASHAYTTAADSPSTPHQSNEQ